MGIHIVYKCAIEQNTNTILHKPKGEAHNQAKQGHNERRIRLNQNQTASSLLGTHMDPLKRPKGVDPPKMGPKGPSGGAAAPVVALFGPKLHGSVHTMSLRTV